MILAREFRWPSCLLDPSLSSSVFKAFGSYIGLDALVTAIFKMSLAIAHQYRCQGHAIVALTQATADLVVLLSFSIPSTSSQMGHIAYFCLPRIELSLTVPITNSLAFLFTVLGDWYVDGKIISKDTWLGMALVCAGIALCVMSKT